LDVQGYSAADALPIPLPGWSSHPETSRRWGILWSSIDASPPYEIFIECAEVLAGVLMVIAGTTTAGALVCLADTTEVFMLNMTQDVR
jgi:hypothetical protein